MSGQQGDVVQVMDFAVAAQPTCTCCDQPPFGGDGFFKGSLCEQHTEISIFIWRLRERGGEISLGGLTELMQHQKPVTFRVSDLPRLFKQYEAAGLLEAK